MLLFKSVSVIYQLTYFFYLSNHNSGREGLECVIKLRTKVVSGKLVYYRHFYVGLPYAIIYQQYVINVSDTTIYNMPPDI